jgi:hypothetical protein
MNTKATQANSPSTSRDARATTQIDETLWAAYRRYDKSAVTEELLRRYLPGLALIPELNAAPDPGRKSVRNEIISGPDRSENGPGRKKGDRTTHRQGKYLLRLTSNLAKTSSELCSGQKTSR